MDYQLGPGPLQVDQNTTDEKIKGDIGIVENGDIATHAILKDYYVIWKGNLYKAKTDISSGTTLSAESNGNLDPKSNGLGGEVAALNSNLNNLSTSALIINDQATVQTNNLNDIDHTSMYTYNGDSTGAPTTNGGVVLTITSYGGSQRRQFAFVNNQAFITTRRYVNGWGSWEKITTQTL